MAENYVITENGIKEAKNCKEKILRPISTKEELEELLERISIWKIAIQFALDIEKVDDFINESIERHMKDFE